MQSNKSNWRIVVERVRNFADAYENTHDAKEYPEICKTCVQNGYSLLPPEIKETLTLSKFEFLFKRRKAENDERKKQKK